MLNPTQFVFLNGMFHFRFPNCYCIFPTLLFPAHARYAVSVRWEREMEEEESRRREGRKKTRCTCTHEDFHTLCCCGARRIGGMFMLMEKRDGSPVVIAGPCWPFCTFITLPLIVVLSGLVSYFVVLNRESPLPWWFAFIYFPILGLTLLALFCVSCRDPGLLERVTDEEAGHGGWFWNEQVGSFRPPGAMYCRECKVLIQDYDHLCPWTGTGIGKGNMLAFKVFVVMVNVLCYLSIGVVAFALLSGFA
uniref:Palmitoyltransferase n=1 Tax=Odontella aurita TaxID=265563 RepID=A0A7S4JBP6_9STRA|mmetsp:Transcript_43312/g.131789  ORF Transcript_43312/g.131789 Transcript_43312/m.131789 type:complete len:249 (+) Transcript_43312:449-1195(+)